jgi:hypothetical protein
MRFVDAQVAFLRNKDGCSGIKTEDINIVREFLDRWSRDGNMSE